VVILHQDAVMLPEIAEILSLYNGRFLTLKWKGTNGFTFLSTCCYYLVLKWRNQLETLEFPSVSGKAMSQEESSLISEEDEGG